MLYLLIGFVGVLFLVEGIIAPIRSIILTLKTSNGDVYLKFGEYEGYSLDDYLNIAFIVIGLLLVFGSLIFWMKSRNLF